MISYKVNETFKKITFCSVILFITVVINICGAALASKIVIPMYLDSVLTIAITAVCGLIPGILCALLTNIFLTLFYNTVIFFVICHICTAILAWLVFSYENKRKLEVEPKRNSIDSFLWAGLWSSISNTILGNLIVTIFINGSTGRGQIDASTQGIYLLVGNLTAATYISGLLTNLLDKIISAIISFFAYRMFFFIKNKLFNN